MDRSIKAITLPLKRMPEDVRQIIQATKGRLSTAKGRDVNKPDCVYYMIREFERVRLAGGRLNKIPNNEEISAAAEVALGCIEDNAPFIEGAHFVLSFLKQHNDVGVFTPFSNSVETPTNRGE